MKSPSMIVLLLILGRLLPAAGSDRWVSRTLKKMRLEEKIAQMVFAVTAPNFLNQDHEYYQYLRHLVQDLKIGGLHVWTSPTYDLAFMLNRFQSWAKVPLLITADLERGAGTAVQHETYQRPDARTRMPAYLTGGGVLFPPLMALGATGSEELARAVGAVTAREARAVGIHFIFSPVMDVNNNPDNPIINVRSFGEQVELVQKLGAAYIRGCQANHVLATAKHFPGHGDTRQDTHIELPLLDLDRERLERIELPPFAAAIAAGVKAIMSAHIALPALSGDSTPATLSAAILTDLLRKKMAFQGLIVTDALIMGGITQKYSDRQAAAEAVKAGADILLYPASPEEAVAGVKEAVARGEISKQRIDDSVRRILAAKKWAGLDRSPQVDLNQIEKTLGKREYFDLARTIAEKALTLLKNDNRLLPLRSGSEPIILKISDQYGPQNGLLFREELKGVLPLGAEYSLWQESNSETIAQVRQQIPAGSLVVCPAYFVIGAWKGNLAVPPLISQFLKELKDKGCRLVLISFGSPYIFRELPFVDTYLCAYSSTAELERAAAQMLVGKLKPQGKFPVSIPGYFNYQEGLSY